MTFCSRGRTPSPCGDLNVDRKLPVSTENPNITDSDGFLEDNLPKLEDDLKLSHAVQLRLWFRIGLSTEVHLRDS